MSDSEHQRKNTRLFEYDGKLRSVQEISELTGVKASTLRARIRAGYPDEYLWYKGNVPKSALSEIVREKCIRNVEYNNVSITLYEASIQSGIGYSTLKRRYDSGKRGAELFKKPSYTNKKNIQFGSFGWI